MDSDGLTLTLRLGGVHVDVLLQLTFVLMAILGIDALRADVLLLAVAVGAGRVVGEDQHAVYIPARIEIVGVGEIRDDPLGADHGRVVAVQEGALRHLLYDAKDVALAHILLALKEVHRWCVFLRVFDALGYLRPLGNHEDAVRFLLIRR